MHLDLWLAAVPYFVCACETKLNWQRIVSTVCGCCFELFFSTDISVTAGRRTLGYGVLCTVFCIISFFSLLGYARCIFNDSACVLEAGNKMATDWLWNVFHCKRVSGEMDHNSDVLAGTATRVQVVARFWCEYYYLHLLFCCFFFWRVESKGLLCIAFVSGPGGRRLPLPYHWFRSKRRNRSNKESWEKPERVFKQSRRKLQRHNCVEHGASYPRPCDWGTVEGYCDSP